MKTKIVPSRRLRSIHYISAIVLLWGLSDAIVSFYIPIQIQTYVNNLALFGFLLGFSSLVGALSDPIIGFISSKTRYLSLLVCGLALSAALAVTALLPFSIILIVWLMAVWGLYYELINVAIFHYVSRHHNEHEQSRYFGIIYLFMNMAYVIGPILAGYVVSHGSHTIYGLCILLLATAILMVPQLKVIHRHREPAVVAYDHKMSPYSFRKQLRSFRKVWRYTSIFLVAIFLFNVWDSFVWGLVPIQSIGGSAIVAGLVTSIFTLPLAVLSGYGGAVADKLGRNATFLLGLFVAAIFTFTFGLQSNFVGQMATALLASLGFAFASPAMMGETAQQGLDHPSELGNMAAVQRLFVNGGFILGPIIGGYVAKSFGVYRAFSVLGAVMLVCVTLIAAKMIHFHIKGRSHRELQAEFEL